MTEALLFRNATRKSILRLNWNTASSACIIWLWIVLLSPSPLLAEQELIAGVAANFILPFESLSGAFEQKTAIRVKATFTSTGNLYSQIKNGAPYDLFLSADERHPRMLQQEGLAEEPFVYARGKLILWTAKERLCKLAQWQDVLSDPSVAKIAIANPETAPYGAAAVEALKRTGWWEKIKPRLVFAQNIAQVFQYAQTESADAGFCALSSAYSEQGRKGCYVVIPEAPEVVQSACILKRTKQQAAALAFVEFLSSPEAKAMNRRYGYE
jgi:molybdate transport system substrate-binding protein